MFEGSVRSAFEQRVDLAPKMVSEDVNEQRDSLGGSRAGVVQSLVQHLCTRQHEGRDHIRREHEPFQKPVRNGDTSEERDGRVQGNLRALRLANGTQGVAGIRHGTCSHQRRRGKVARTIVQRAGKGVLPGCARTRCGRVV